MTKKESTAAEIVKGFSPQKLAEELCAVQPMPNDCWPTTMKQVWDEKTLREHGYEPVDPITKLLWVKK